jgi:glycosyltransferase involved in cell wall biosynthesis
MPMKVLHVYRTYFPDPPGGLQEAIRQICISTQAYGVQNTVFTLSPLPVPQVIERPEARVVRCRSWAAPASCDLGASDALHTFRQLAKEADVVHYLFPWPFADVLRCVAPRKPSVLTYISDIVRQRWLGSVYGPLMWKTLRSMDAIVSNAPAYAAGSPVLSDPSLQPLLRQIPLGIDESTCTVNADERIFDKLGLKALEPFVLFVGVLRYYKGLHVLLQACQHIKGHVVVAGDGPEMAALQAQAMALGLQNVVFAGFVTDAEKMALLKACRGLVLPSHLRSEAYGMVLVEASMMGKPMVTCEIGTGTSFVNQHGVTGWVVPPESPDALAQAMNQLLADEGLAERYGRAARLRYEARFSGPVVGRAYADAFADVLTTCH